MISLSGNFRLRFLLLVSVGFISATFWGHKLLAGTAPAGIVVAWGDYDNYGVEEVVPPGMTNVIGISAGNGFTIALNADGTVVNWGSSHSAPGTGNVPAGVSNVVSIAAGYQHCIALKSDGTLVAWGDNSYGQTRLPAGLSNVVAIAAGGYHNLALKKDGTVVGWGDNTNWIGNYVGQATPPVGLSNVVAITAGGYHSLALRNDGIVVGWGDDLYYQLDQPVGLTNVAAISAGDIQSAALRSDGTVVGWGYPVYGVAAPPPGLSRVIGIASGGWENLALEGDGTVVGWGYDEFGALEIPDTLTNVMTVSAGFWHGVALVGNAPPLISTNSVCLIPLPVSQAAPPEREFHPVVGDSIQFYPAGFGAAPSTYQWRRNGVRLSDATNAALVLDDLQPSQSGNYSLRIVNAFGFPASAIVHLTVVPLAITSQPRDQFALGGTNVEFDVAANGPGPLSYQWRYNGTDLVGSTNSSLVLSNVFPAQSGTYSVLVSNVYGSVQSATAVLGVAPLEVDVEPQGLTVLGGTNVELDAAASGIGPFLYQWQFDGTNISRATNAALILTNLAPSNSGMYSVVVSNSYGSVVSSNSQLTVLPFAITLQPTNRSTYTGATVTFSVGTGGSPPFAYQWQFDGANLPGATNSVLSLTNVGRNATGTYAVIVSNQFGVIASSNAVLLFSQIAAWGSNTNAESTTPPDLTNAVMISAGYYHAMALKSDGTVSAWGYNGDGETDVPAGLSNVVTVAAGGFHCLALKSDSTVVAWGAGTIDYGDYSGFSPHGQAIIPVGLSNVVAVAGGGFHSLALKSDGTIAAWGWNLSGQTTVPSGLNNVVAMAAGYAHSLALKSDGTVVAWGYNHEGELNMPAGLSNVVAIAAGNFFSLALEAGGTVIAWGDDSAGQTDIPAGLSNVVGIAANGDHCLALKSDGTVVGWGDNSAGQNDFPPGLTNLVMITSGAYFNLALVGSGPPVVIVPSVHLTIQGGQPVYLPGIGSGLSPLIFQWQRNGMNLPGATNPVLTLIGTQAMSGVYSLSISNSFGSTTSSNVLLTVIPLVITGSPAGQNALAGTGVSLSVSATGWTPFNYQWRFDGTNLPSATNQTLTLTNIQPLQAGTYSVAVGNDFGVVLSSDALVSVTPLVITSQPVNQSTFIGGAANFAVTASFQGPFTYQWRLNGNPISGATNGTLSLTNVQLNQAGTYSVTVGNGLGSVLSSGAALAVSQAAGWGYNIYGQASGPAGLTNAVAIAAGAQHNLAILGDGTVMAWGLNSSGQTTVPAGLKGVIGIAAGGIHSLALLTNRTIVAWGANNYGQGKVPAGLSNVAAVAAGFYHSVALLTNGTVIVWGNNGFGQTNVPAGLSNVVAVAAGGYHVLALKSDSTLVAWGQNIYGQSSVPPGLSNVVAVAGGVSHSVALRNDGTVIAWGDNSYGRTNVPAGLSNVVAIAAGGHSLALKNDGTVAAWGFNGYGQITVPAALKNVEAIAAGGYHSLALINEGAPYITEQPPGRQVIAGTTVSLDAAAMGSPSLNYQWQFNGTNIVGATSPALLLTNVPLESSGQYTCSASNTFGIAVSLPAMLDVLRTIPQFDSGPQFDAGGFGFELHGLSGHGPVVIFASTNLLDWIPVYTNPAVLGTLQIHDPSASSLPLRFYKAAEQ
jgi:alpha-tubulin suppressor-like RCC1 family protein